MLKFSKEEKKKKKKTPPFFKEQNYVKKIKEPCFDCSRIIFIFLTFLQLFNRHALKQQQPLYYKRVVDVQEYSLF
jgi:hypothetical protein